MSRQDASRTAPRFSFIIPAYNEELLIGRAIHSIRNGADALEMSYEIIVADDASDDLCVSVPVELQL